MRRVLSTIGTGLAAAAGLFAGGCVERTMTFDSQPSGALVYVNDREVGRTPAQMDFTQYGWYDVEVRKEGFETAKVRQRVLPPVWQIPPIDLLAEFMPWRPKDRRNYTYELKPTTDADPDAMLSRAAELRGQLEGSRVQAK
jgi:hypothetical protein